MIQVTKNGLDTAIHALSLCCWLSIKIGKDAFYIVTIDETMNKGWMYQEPVEGAFQSTVSHQVCHPRFSAQPALSALTFPMAPPTATNEPPILLDTTMVPEETSNINDMDPNVLSRYIDPEFLNAKPDDRVRTVEQALTQEQEELEDPPELLNDFEVEEQTKPMALEPREYQYELYLKAVEENVIAVLDTGSGKTLIAVMLIKTIAAQEREERLKRRHVSRVSNDSDLHVLFIIMHYRPS